MRDTVLVTGGAGLLALNWAIAARGGRRVVLGLHRRQVCLAGVEAQNVDLESIDGVARACDAFQPDCVVHTAGLTNIEACERDPDLARRVNVDLAGHVAGACARAGIPLVHISTDHLFSGQEALVDETEPVAPVNVYARTKAEAEARVLDAHPGALVVRTNFFGWGPSYRPSFSDRLLGTLRTGTPMTLFRDVFFTPVLIETLVQAVTELVQRGVTGVVHVAGDDRVSKHEFGLLLAAEFGLNPDLLRPGRLGDDPALVTRPHDMSLSNAKLTSLVGRSIGGIRQQLARLHDQERAGLARELQTL